MGEVAEMFDVNQSLLRFWEQRFKILKPKKNKKGNRLFTPDDIKNLELIYHLVKERGMTLSGAEKTLQEKGSDVERDAKVVKKLQEIRSVLLEIREGLKENTDPSLKVISIDNTPAASLPDTNEEKATEVIEETVVKEEILEADPTEEGEGDTETHNDEYAPLTESDAPQESNEELCEPLPFISQPLFEVEATGEPVENPGEEEPEPEESAQENNNVIQQSLF